MIRKNTFLFVFICVMLLVVLGVSCAPASQPQSPGSAPAITPSTPAPDSKPAAASPSSTGTSTSVPAAKKTSYEADVYTNDQYKFTLSYPKSWVKKDLTGDEVFSIAATANTGADAVRVYAMAETKDFANDVKAVVDQTAAFKQLGAKSKIESQKSTTLADGKTPAAETVLSAKLAAYDMYLYCLGTNLGGKTIAVVAYTLRSNPVNKDLVREIASTLAVK